MIRYNPTIIRRPTKRNKGEESDSVWVNSPRDDKTYKDVWRFVVGNINTLPSPSSPLGVWKIDTWKDLVMKCDVNILTEINKDMSKVKGTDKLEEITKGWWKGAMIRTEYLIEEDYNFRQQR